MKKKVLYGATFLVAIMMMFTSCLGDGDNQISLNNQPGVIRFDMKTSKNVMDTGYGPIYNPIFDNSSNFQEGGCYLVSFTLNQDRVENSNGQAAANGYYTVDLLASPTLIEKGMTFSSIRDTTEVYPDEQALTSAIVSSGEGQYMFFYVNGYAFIQSYFTGLNKQETAWELSYNGSVSSSMVEVDGKHVYDLYLRATITKEGSTPSEDFAPINAYYIKGYVDQINQAEQNNSAGAFYFRINYIKSIKDGVATWGQSGLMGFGVTKEE